MSKQYIECPLCLGSKEEYFKGNIVKKCSLCKGKGEVDAILAEDFISSINIIDIDHGDIIDDES